MEDCAGEVGVFSFEICRLETGWPRKMAVREICFGAHTGFTKDCFIEMRHANKLGVLEPNAFIKLCAVKTCIALESRSVEFGDLLKLRTSEMRKSVEFCAGKTEWPAEPRISEPSFPEKKLNLRRKLLPEELRD